jgi:hypothetical protein
VLVSLHIGAALWHLVRAEMNGLDFDHRVLRPWASNPAFYVTVFPSQSDQPAREGHQAFGAVELWSYRYPLSADDAAALGVVSDKLRYSPLSEIKNITDQALAVAGAIPVAVL